MGGRSYDRHAQPIRGPATSSKKRKPAKTSRGLNALEIAEQENPDDFKIRQHRLGEIEDEPAEKRSYAGLDDQSAKRRRIDNSSAPGQHNGEDEDPDSASDSEGNHWHTGVVGDDEDSDIDSDEAFGESDEERFDGFTFRGSSNPVTKSSKPRQKSRTKNLDQLDENDPEEDGELSDDIEGTDEEDDDLGEEAVDLATALDMNEDADREEASLRSRKKAKDSGASEDDRDSDTTSEGDLGDFSEDHDDVEESQSEFSVSNDEDGGHDRLQRFVENISSRKEKENATSKTAVRNLPDKPSQFGLASTKISASELLELVKDPIQRQALKVLQSNEKRTPETQSKGISGRLAVPLAKRQQDRLDRVAAYDQSRKELGRWIDTVKENRRAEHLSFPLAEPGDSSYSTEQFAPLAQSTAVNPLETAIKTILEESGLATRTGSSFEDQEREFEELQEKKMPLAEVQARRAELRKARDLMFREEIRAKRIKKIKSKAYRRVHRKEKDKIKQMEQAQLEAHGLVDSDEEREKNDRRRAEERMGARHRESKWAKAVKQVGRAGWDEDARQGVVDLARRDEDLRRRVEGKADRSSDDDAEESDSEDFSDIDDENRALQARLDTLGSGDQDHAHSRLSHMAFMQKAEAARKKANDDEIRRIRLDLDGETHSSASPGAEDLELPGRQKFGTSARADSTALPRAVRRNEFEAPLSEDDEETAAANPDEDQAQGTESTPKISRKVEHAAPGKEKPAQRNGREESLVPNEKQNRQNGLKSSDTHGKSSDRLQTLDETSSSSDEDFSDAERNPEPVAEMSLAAAIFAGPDDAVKEFRKEKQITVVEEDDQVQDNSLPGWGNWTGVGISKRAQKKAASSGRFATVIKGIKADQRQDAKLDRVIINEKRIKKNNKYLASELPHPFESKQQYERAMRLPLGPEWTTKSTFQDATKPRVILKQGVILPMARPAV